MKIIFLLTTLLVANSALAALTPEFSMYMRAGVNNNVKGGGQECINNPDTWGNEFRLGNECGIYGEFGLGATLLKDETGTGPMWRMFSNFAVQYDNRQDWEGVNVTTQTTGANPATVNSVSLNNGNNWVLRELYTEGGNFDGMNFTAWAGKRFYRWGDVHMDDFYPVNMSAPGAGIGNIRSGWGTWSVAVLQNTTSSEQEGSGNVTTTAGKAAKTSLHIRLDDSETAFGKWSFWLAGAVTPQTKNQSSTQDYKGGTGLFVAAKNYSNVADGVGNEFGVAFGQGAMTNMGPGGELIKNCESATDPACSILSSNRARLWDAMTIETKKWSTQAALIYDELNKGTTQNARVRWASIGVRPMYWFTDHISLAFQAGLSNVLNDSDGKGSRSLARYTVSPQLSLGKGFYSRPVIRAFYSRTEWNKNNVASFSSTSAGTDTWQDSLGFQTEIWF